MEKSRKRIKIDLLDKFREIEESPDTALPGGWLRNDYLAGLSSCEKRLFEQAVGELAASGLVEYTPGEFPEVRLTLKGGHLIYC
jgi:hypothetical protein